MLKTEEIFYLNENWLQKKINNIEIYEKQENKFKVN